MSEDSLEMWLREAPIAAIAGSLEFDEGTGLLLSTDRRSSQFRLGFLFGASQSQLFRLGFMKVQCI